MNARVRPGFYLAVLSLMLLCEYKEGSGIRLTAPYRCLQCNRWIHNRNGTSERRVQVIRMEICAAV